MEVVAVNRTERAIWNQSPFILSWNSHAEVPLRDVYESNSVNAPAAVPWVDTGPHDQPFNFSHATRALCADICRHTPELRHIRTEQILFGFIQARNRRGHGLQARVTPLRFAGGHLIRPARGRLFQVQRFAVSNQEMLYLMAFCLPRFLNQDFDEKFVTIFHELFHIGPNFDGDLRRHRGRYCMHTRSKSKYDARMSHYARAYLSAGANPQLHGYLRMSFAQLCARHGRVVGHVLPRAKILPLPLDDSQSFERVASRHL